MTSNPRLMRTITNGILLAITRSSRRMLADIETEHGGTPGFVEGNPMLDFVSKALECNAGKVRIVGHEFVLVQGSAISLEQLVGKIPVIQGDEGLDSSCVEIVDEFGVKVYSFLIDGVVSAT